MVQGLSLGDPNLDSRLKKSDTLQKVGFEASIERGVETVFKQDDSFVIWGPASVEIVDKEGDKITVEALDKALPQLLKRARLSLEHTDQIVGRIVQSFKTEDSVKVEIDGTVYERSEFPTDVLELDNGNPPALYVAGEIYNDTEQSKRAREQIEQGELNSYSISGEALVTRKQVEDGNVYDDIIDMDLSAVTLCQEGMNQGAKYARITEEVEDIEAAGPKSVDKTEQPSVPMLNSPEIVGVGQNPAKAVSKTMSDSESNSEEESEKSLEETVSKAVSSALPDEDLATVKFVESLVDGRLEEFKAEHEEVGMPGGMSEAGVEEPETTNADGDGDMTMSDGDAATSSTYDKQDEEISTLAEHYEGLSEKEIRDLLENASEGADGDDEVTASDDEQTVDEEMSKNVREARDTIAEQLGVPKTEANKAINQLLSVDSKEDYEDEDYEDYEEEDEDEMPEEMMEMEDGEHEDEMMEEEGDEDDMDDKMSVDELERQLPDDVWDVVSEYVGESSNSAKGMESPTDILEGNEKADEDIEKQVREVLEGGAEVNGADAVPTEKDERDEPYTEKSDDDSEGTSTSPALEQFYG